MKNSVAEKTLTIFQFDSEDENFREQSDEEWYKLLTTALIVRIYKKQNIFILWVWLTLEKEILLFHPITFRSQSVYLSGEIVPLE